MAAIEAGGLGAGNGVPLPQQRPEGEGGNGAGKAGSSPLPEAIFLADQLDDQLVLSLFRAGVLLVVFFHILFLAVSAAPGRHLTLEVLALHWFNIGAPFAAFLITYTEFFSRRWRPLTFCLCCACAITSAFIAAISGEAEFLALELVLLMTGTGALVPWSPGWQSAYIIIVIASYARVAGLSPAGAHGLMGWVANVTAAGVSLCAVAMSQSHRRKMACGLGKLREEGARREAAIAELEHTHRQLAQSEDKLRRLFEACPDTICVNSMIDGRYIAVNKRFSATGYSSEETLGVPTSEHRIWADRNQHREFVRKLRSRGIVHNFEADFRQKDGTVVPCLMSGVTVEIDGEPCSMTITSDVSRLKQTERELIAAREAALAASRAKSEFLSSMSHEIRTPMNAILGMADLLAESELSEEQHKFLSTMISNGNALLHLISDILDLAKVESGRLTLEQVGFDLDDAMSKVGEALAVRAHEKGLELVCRVSPDSPTKLIGDPLRLRQVLINLVGNAIKFTTEGSVIVEVERATASDDRITFHFAVCDTGIGIAADKLQDIFLNFTQADASTERKYGGSGLGLAIGKRLVEMMGGRIWVESQVGVGSTFHFTADFKLQPPGSDEVQETAGVDLRGIRTLVVDDIAVNRLVVREALSSVGAEVGEADSGQGALDELERAALSGRPYLLLVLDCRMPGMDGIEVVRRVRSANAPRKVIVVMLTSDDLNVQLARAREAGVDAYLVKPIRRSELLEAVSNAFKKAQRKQTPPALRPFAPAAQSVAQGTRPLRILLAEDSPDNRLLIEAYLKKTPHILDSAENGEIAVERFKAGRYDVVLMDISMPVMDGYGALRGIREWERANQLAATPVIALTAAAFPEHVNKAKEAGFQMYVTKPVKKATLLAAVEEVTADTEQKRPVAPTRITVVADPDLYDLTVNFVAHKREDLKKIQDAIDKGDYQTITRMGHTLKGEGGSFGMDPVTEIGSELERAGKAGSEADARRLLRSLRDYLERVEVVSQMESPNGAPPEGVNGRA